MRAFRERSLLAALFLLVSVTANTGGVLEWPDPQRLRIIQRSNADYHTLDVIWDLDPEDTCLGMNVTIEYSSTNFIYTMKSNKPSVYMYGVLKYDNWHRINITISTVFNKKGLRVTQEKMTIGECCVLLVTFCLTN